MGFEDFNVLLTHREGCPLWSDPSLLTPQKLADEIQAQWSAIHQDCVAEQGLPYPKRPDEVFLCYETSTEIFQILIEHTTADGQIVVSLRFAYCNTRSIYDPFCEVIEWLMGRYQFRCYPMRCLSPPGPSKPCVEPIENPEDVRRVLIPGMDYNRSLWQLTLRQLGVSTEEEAALRPEEAIARFILPRIKPTRTGQR